MAAKEQGRAFRIIASPVHRTLVDRLLESEGIQTKVMGFYAQARRAVKETFPLGSSLAAAFGYIYIQDISSMLPPLVLAPAKGSIVLDMCASPGGKSSLLAELVGNSGMVIANEPQPKRYETLRRNMHSLNQLNVITTRYQGQKISLPDESISAILLDVPCSGWGTVAKNPKVEKIWNESTVEDLISLQRALLTKAAAILRPGGKLLYSTCTTNPKENREQIRWALSTLPLLEAQAIVPENVPAPIERNGQGCLQVNTSQQSQGFFMALLTKDGSKKSVEVLSPSFLGDDVRFLDQAMNDAGISKDQCPDGEIRGFGKNLYFLPERSRSPFFNDLKWKACRIGKYNGRTVSVDPKMNILLPEKPDNESLVTTDLQVIHNLRQGQSMLATAGNRKKIGLYFGSLPLGWIQRKGKRYVWSGQ